MVEKINKKRMMKLFFVVLTLFVFCFLPQVLAFNFDTGQEEVELKTETSKCINLYQYCPACSYVNITAIKYPNNSMSTTQIAMTKTGYNYYYEFCDTSDIGEYFYTTCGDKDGVLCEVIAFEVEQPSYAKFDVASVLLMILGFCFILYIYLKVHKFIGSILVAVFGFVVIFINPSYGWVGYIIAIGGLIMLLETIFGKKRNRFRRLRRW